MKNLYDDERSLCARLATPPPTASICPSYVLVVEWLATEDRKTGFLLHQWMDENWPGRTQYVACTRKRDVIVAIDQASARARDIGITPVLHVEAHGSELGLEGPDASGGTELLVWDELTEPLQCLNLATKCNLILVVAACTGYAAVQALNRGPRAPVMALLGTDGTVMPRDLLEGSKEIYRRMMDSRPNMNAIALSASQQAGTVNFELEPFVNLAYDATIKDLLNSMRPAEVARKTEIMRQELVALDKFSTAEIEQRLLNYPAIQREVRQAMWDEMFMLDMYPENRARFALDVSSIVSQISTYYASLQGPEEKCLF